MAARKNNRRKSRNTRRAGARKLTVTLSVSADRLVKVLKSLPGRTTQVLDIA
jgi:hypothetical protein